MAKKAMKKAKGRAVKGCDYAADEEEYDKKEAKKAVKKMKTAGLAKELKKSQKEEGYSKKLSVKPQKKNAKPVRGKKIVY